MGNLAADIESWDKKKVQVIIGIYQTYCARIDFADDLLRLLEKSISTYEQGVTWLIKHHVEQGGMLAKRQVSTLLRKILPNLDHWEAKLHVFQILPLIVIPTSCASIVFNTAMINCSTNKVFLRAWCFQAMAEACRVDQRYTQQVNSICQRAIKTESAAVRARIKMVLLRLNQDT